jgi:hypothetical protein
MGGRRRNLTVGVVFGAEFFYFCCQAPSLCLSVLSIFIRTIKKFKSMGFFWLLLQAEMMGER